MPIGYEQGGGGGRSGTVRGAPDSLLETWQEQLEDVVETISDVLEWVEVRVEQLFATPLERWETHQDERTCPQCSGLDGQIWPSNEGAFPPVHDHCRCTRVAAGVSWQSRPVVRWVRQPRAGIHP